MAQVSLRINGYAYILGCADGEETHLRELASDLDQRVDAIKATAGPSGEARLLLMAALVLSDELSDLRRQSEESRPNAGNPAEKTDPKLSKRIARIARRAEAIASQADEAASVPAGTVTHDTYERPPENIAAPSEQP